MFDLLDEAIQQKIEKALSNINTSMPAKIVSIDHAKNRAIVKPDLPKAIANGEELESPQIVEVPIVWQSSSSGNASMTFPLGPGDHVMLQFQQRSIEGWLDGKMTAPDDPRQFDLSDCVAIAGGAPGGISGHSENIVLKFNKANLTLRPDSSVVFGNDKGSIVIDAGGNITIKGVTVNINP